MLKQKNRRRYDNSSAHDLLVQHIEDDEANFKKLDRCERMLWTIMGGIILLGLIITNPLIFHNLTMGARAEASER